MFKKLVVSALTSGILVIGGTSTYADKQNITDNGYFGLCKNVSQNVEANEYVKNCTKIFMNPPLGPIVEIPDTILYDDGTYQGTLYQISQKRTNYSITASYEGTLKKYK
ncbi:hypothetical protein CN887_29810 [Bacillus pseudomycoides]|uniref:hypothetical protein n=1 Tax=Bacillus pseudomycoides TaxID=64104 RepID=UPI000BF14472|nr:hypothetical protein [Bacillus pseudomycoides]PEJ17835.1 hypothetical protein CN887_29810 [Bacillus pseudomycoides]